MLSALTRLAGTILAAARWRWRVPRPRRRGGVPFKEDASGGVIIADTPEWWAEWTSGIDRDIQDELDASPYRGGQPSWNDAWLERLVTNSHNVEHAPRYVGYIIDARRRAGLSDLAGFVQDKSGTVFLVDTADWGRATWAEEWEARIQRALTSCGISAGRFVDYIHQARHNAPAQ